MLNVSCLALCKLELCAVVSGDHFLTIFVATCKLIKVAFKVTAEHIN